MDIRREPDQPARGMGVLGVFLWLVIAAVVLFFVDLGRILKGRLDPCVSEGGVPCPDGLSTIAVGLWMIGIGFVGMAATYAVRTKKRAGKAR